MRPVRTGSTCKHTPMTYGTVHRRTAERHTEKTAICTIGRAGDVAGIDVGRLTPSKKVLDYDYAYFNRPYNSSNLLIGEIISTGPPGPDPRGSAGMWWKVPGSFNGTEGTFEVLISPDGRTVWHFLFRSK